jgi:hypothetical protein
LKILGIERSEIRNNAKVFGMSKHGAKKSDERIGESLAKSWSNRKSLMGFSEPPMTTKAEGFIQIDAEHGVRRFKTTQRVQVRSGFFCGERGSPVFRHRTGTKRRKTDPHFRPPRDELKSFGSIAKVLRIDNILFRVPKREWGV